MSDTPQPENQSPRCPTATTPEPAKKSRRSTFLALVRLFFAFGLLWYGFLLFMTGSDQRHTLDLELARGTSLDDLSVQLEKAGIIKSPFHFRLVARLRGLDRKMQAGDYRLHGAMRVQDVLTKLVKGKVDSCRFTLPEGFSSYQAAAILHNGGLIDRTRFLTACRDKGLLKQLSINASSVEGYLYPGTYQIRFYMDEKELIQIMVANHRRQMAKVAGMKSPGTLTMHQVIIMASMIEREAMRTEEKPMIASVFHNRLAIGMPLQSDPTATYGVRAGGKVTKADLAHVSPYNTYKIPGLPVGPIGNPHLSSIKAVLQPATTDYLYFVARKDGTHQFSKSYQLHQQAIQQYLK